MCPYYLDGDQTEPARVRPVIPVVTRAYRVRVTCGYCAVFKGRPRGLRAYAGTVAGDGRRGLSKLNSMHGLELGGMPRWPGQVRSTC